MNPSMPTPPAEAAERAVLEVIPAERTVEGAGFPVRRPFPTARLPMVDPFLMIDELGPVDWAPGEAIGAPDHPHRGFETVSYVLQGRKQHRDSQGHSGVLGPGDVQWMTAGAGVVHSEMPEADFQRTGGRAHSFQIWVNLPARAKGLTPRYQELPGNRIPERSSQDGKAHVRVIAGSALGANAPTQTHTAIMLLHFTLQPGAELLQPVPAAHRAMAYVFRGSARLGAERLPVPDGHLAIFGPGEDVRLGTDARAETTTELLLLTGEPLNEPVARYGPFVMNTRQEILDAFHDYEAGRMGRIPPEVI